MIIGGEGVNPRLHLLMHQAVADRLLHDAPPEDWLELETLLERAVAATGKPNAAIRRRSREVT